MLLSNIYFNVFIIVLFFVMVLLSFVSNGEIVVGRYIVSFKNIELNENTKKWVLVFFLICLGALHLIRISDISYWRDECYSIVLARRTWSENIAVVAADNHPPLYHLILKAFVTVFGESAAVLRFVSVLAFFGSLFLTFFVIRKEFGYKTAFLFAALNALLSPAITLNLEIRMYSWASFFVLGAFLSLWLLLKDNRLRYYVCMAVASLGAAYCHYYALLSVAFLYAFLLGYSLVTRDKKRIINAVISSLICIVGYWPWLFVLIDSFVRRSGSWWLDTYTNFAECTNVLFNGSAKTFLVVLFLSLTPLLLVLDNHLIRFRKKDREPEMLSEEVAGPGYRTLWMAGGLLAIFGTMTTGIVVSDLIRPLFQARYMYPVSCVAWLILAYVISRCKSKAAFLLAMCIVLWGGAKDYGSICRSDANEESRLKVTLYQIDLWLADMEEKTIVVNTKNEERGYRVFYADESHRMLEPDELDKIRPKERFCIIFQGEMPEHMRQWLENNHCESTYIIEGGSFSGADVFVVGGYRP